MVETGCLSNHTRIHAAASGDFLRRELLYKFRELRELGYAFINERFVVKVFFDNRRSNRVEQRNVCSRARGKMQCGVARKLNRARVDNDEVLRR